MSVSDERQEELLNQYNLRVSLANFLWELSDIKFTQGNLREAYFLLESCKYWMGMADKAIELLTGEEIEKIIDESTGAK